MYKVPVTWTGRLDSVTELPGVAIFDEFYHEAWNLGIVDSRPLSIIIVGVSRVDNAELKTIGKALTESVGRVLDMVARIDARQFGMVLPDTDLEGALAVAERMQEAIRKATENRPVEIYIGVSSIVPNPRGNATSMMALVRRALQAARQGGDGQIGYIGKDGKVVLGKPAVSDDSDELDWELI